MNETPFRRNEWIDCCGKHSYDLQYSQHHHGAVLVRCWHCGGDVGYVYPSFEKRDARVRAMAKQGFQKHNREEAIDTDTTTPVLRKTRDVTEQNRAVQDWLYKAFNVDTKVDS